MSPKVILCLMMGANLGFLLPLGSQLANAAVSSERTVATQQSALDVEVIDLAGRDFSEFIIAGNSSNSNSNSNSNSSSNSNSNSDSDSGRRRWWLDDDDD
ncbi:hypothetical protein [Leptolyngbya sp. FACHB-261]|uniref:hypothetical protein n=1 Tax=Leptolyngbya sp. FACHB-261 TaxID=2692806 RepID=UPI0016826E0B|nr:hypothetical protein [Leptolyngbya sp. FACHB-261]MBD2102488.1 hypothetical protein [Leptolyngbya sp. FACHB-261]